jgi:hypothetical protein
MTTKTIIRLVLPVALASVVVLLHEPVLIAAPYDATCVNNITGWAYSNNEEPVGYDWFNGVIGSAGSFAESEAMCEARAHLVAQSFCSNYGLTGGVGWVQISWGASWVDSQGYTTSGTGHNSNADCDSL